MKKLSIKGLKEKRKVKGFTLIELIIVIAIIAILAAMAIPKFGAIRQTANVKTDIATAKNIQTAVATKIAEGKIDADSTPSADDYKDLLDGDKVPSPKATSDKEFTVQVVDGNITVKVGEDEVYPNQTGDIYGTESTNTNSEEKK